MKQLIAKIRSGSPLSEEEMEQGIVHYRALVEILDLHSPRYDDTLRDAQKELQTLEMMYDIHIGDKLKIKAQS